MSAPLLIAAAFCATLGCGLMAGVFLAFSSFVMSALARLPAPQGIAAMQSVNIRAITPVFMSVFFGTAVVCVFLIAVALISPPASGAGHLIAGGAVYLVGTFLVTIVFNVPRNNQLAAADPQTETSARLWSETCGAGRRGPMSEQSRRWPRPASSCTGSIATPWPSDR